MRPLLLPLHRKRHADAQDLHRHLQRGSRPRGLLTSWQRRVPPSHAARSSSPGRGTSRSGRGGTREVAGRPETWAGRCPSTPAGHEVYMHYGCALVSSVQGICVTRLRSVVAVHLQAQVHQNLERQDLDAGAHGRRAVCQLGQRLPWLILFHAVVEPAIEGSACVVIATSSALVFALAHVAGSRTDRSFHVSPPSPIC